MSAGNQIVRSKAPEDFVNAVADAYCNYAELFLTCLKLCRQLSVLFPHVFNFHAIDFTQIKCQLKDFSGSIGMNMNFDDVLIIHNNNGITDFHKLLTKIFNLLCVRT